MGRTSETRHANMGVSFAPLAPGPSHAPNSESGPTRWLAKSSMNARFDAYGAHDPKVTSPTALAAPAGAASGKNAFGLTLRSEDSGAARSTTGRPSSASGIAYPRVSTVFSPRRTIPAHGSRISNPNVTSGSAKTERRSFIFRESGFVVSFSPGGASASDVVAASSEVFSFFFASSSSSSPLARFPFRPKKVGVSFAKPAKPGGGACAIPRSISYATTSSKGLWWNFTAIPGSPASANESSALSALASPFNSHATEGYFKRSASRCSAPSTPPRINATSACSQPSGLGRPFLGMGTSTAFTVRPRQKKGGRRRTVVISRPPTLLAPATTWPARRNLAKVSRYTASVPHRKHTWSI
mmetsp:Transcript_10277/g.43695  ORF Transcript_10277/g.43695 Transcript_10277/m.43695 type:complete len:355 (-) Transcript_10277:770-1834(-)